MSIWGFSFYTGKTSTSTSTCIYTLLLWQWHIMKKVVLNRMQSTKEHLIVLVHPQRPEWDMDGLMQLPPSPSILYVYILYILYTEKKLLCLVSLFPLPFCMSASQSSAMSCPVSNYLSAHPRHCFGYCILLCIIMGTLICLVWCTGYVHKAGICTYLENATSVN